MVTEGDFMIKLSSKVISSIVGIALAGGVITATAATAQPKQALTDAVPSNSVSSTVPSGSSVVSSKGDVSNVADGIDEINEATQKGVSAVNEAAKAAVSDVASAAKEAGTTSHFVKATRLGYDVFDPDTGEWINPRESRYNAVKAELGGDAGIVPENQSTACQKAIEEYKAKQAAATQAPTK